MLVVGLFSPQGSADSVRMKLCINEKSINPTVEARKLEHSFRRISARIPYTLH